MDDVKKNRKDLSYFNKTSGKSSCLNTVIETFMTFRPEKYQKTLYT